MLTKEQLSGVYVPIVTPFQSTGGLDLESLHHHADRLISAGVHGLVVHGTTGESPTVTAEEVALLMQTARTAVSGRSIPLILGTGANDTAAAVRNTERAGILGADAALVVVPYYNRPSQEGIIEHFRRVSQVGVPVIIYEIPYRTGVKLETDTVHTILEMDGIIGLKDSSGSTQLVTELSQRGSKPVLCGEDALMYASLALGASGLMTAAANVKTDRFVQLYDLMKSGNFREAKVIFDELYPLIQLLFAEPNPGPLKWILKEQGVIASSELRLPLVQISGSLQQKLKGFIQ